MQDIRQSSAWAKYLTSIGWKIEYINNTYVYLKHLPLLGWFAKLQRPNQFNNSIIETIIKKYHPFQISIEPSSNIQIPKYPNIRISKYPSLPTKTLQIDLTKSEKDLLKSFSQKTRYNIKLSERKGVKIIESRNILDFTTFWRKNFEKKRFPIMSQQKKIIALENAFGKKSKILLAKKNNNIIAVLFLLSYGEAEYYMYAAANGMGREDRAPTLLTWQAMLLAKKSGSKIFDFDGIYDERFPIKTWQGFTKFKKGFGGKEIEYPGCFVKTKSIISL